MDALHVREGLTLPASSLSVSYTRDLGGEGTPEAARQTPTTVELRLDVPGSGCFDDAARAKVLAHPALQADRRGTVRVVFGELATRRRNLHEARRRLAALIIEALDRDASHAEATPAPRRRRGRAGLIKGTS